MVHNTLLLPRAEISICFHVEFQVRFMFQTNFRGLKLFSSKLRTLDTKEAQSFIDHFFPIPSWLLHRIPSLQEFIIIPDF